LSREAKSRRSSTASQKNVLEKRGYVLEGVKFGEPEPQYPVDSGVSDLMIPTHTPKPLLITRVQRREEELISKPLSLS